MKKHFTATAYIAAKIDGEYKVLLHKHKKHGFWLGIGGHIEKDENPIEALHREVKEETGLEIVLITDKLLEIEDVKELTCPTAILEEQLSAIKNEPAHKHIDLIYFAICKNPQKIKMEEQFVWVSLEETKKMDLEKETHYILKKLFKKLSYG